MKGFIYAMAALATIVGGVYYDSAVKRDCHIKYDTSFNGLYIIKQRQCYTRIGMAHDPVEVSRQAMFTTF